MDGLRPLLISVERTCSNRVGDASTDFVGVCDFIFSATALEPPSGFGHSVT